MHHYLHNRFAAIILLLPGLILFFVVAVIPLGQLFYFSTVTWNGWAAMKPTFVGLQNFISLFQRTDFLQSVKNVLLLTLWSGILQIPIGYLFGVYLASHNWGYRVVKTFLFVPLVLSLTAVGLMWYFVLMPNGLLNSFLDLLGLSSMRNNWLVNPKTALGCVVVVQTWMSIGFYMILSYGATRSIPKSLIEAATIDGATGFSRFYHIVLPLIWQTLRISIVFVITGTIRIFDLIFVLTDGGPLGTTEVPLTLVYRYAFSYQRYGEGSAMAVLVFIASVLIAWVILKLSDREVVEA